MCNSGKDVEGRRLTYLLRPHVTRQDYAARNVLDTPPATESDASLGVLSESDLASELSDSQSDLELPQRNIRPRRLSSVEEQGSESNGEDGVAHHIAPSATHRLSSVIAEGDATDDADEELSGIPEVAVPGVPDDRPEDVPTRQEVSNPSTM